MIDVIASEWVKFRSVRSSYGLLAAAASAVLLGALVAVLMVADWDGSAPAGRTTFPSADPSVFVVPFAQVCFAALGVIAVTAEYACGMIRTSLGAVPQRPTMLMGKALVVAAVTLGAGQLVAFAAWFAGRLATGDRPAPIAVPPLADALPALLASGLSMAVVGLVGLGLGVVIRSTAGALVAMCVLLFVLPAMAQFFSGPWGNWFASLMLPNLAPQLAGAAPEGVLSPAAALAVMAAYLVAALGAGAVVLTRRDA